MQVEWRRTKVLELLSQGDSRSDIAKTLQVDLSIISRDVYFLRQQAKSNIERYIDENSQAARKGKTRRENWRNNIINTSSDSLY